jgi:hypothetical protein
MKNNRTLILSLLSVFVSGIYCPSFAVEATAKKGEVLPPRSAFVRDLSSTTSRLNVASARSLAFSKIRALSIKDLENTKSPKYDDYVCALAAHEFFRQINSKAADLLLRLPSKQTTGFMKWLVEDPSLLRQFVEIGPIHPYNPAFLADWAEIWEKRPSSRKGFGQRAALALAHANACGHLENHIVRQPLKALERYDWMVKSETAGLFLRNMKEVSLSDLRYIAGARFSNEDLEWCQNYYTTNSVSWKTADKIWQGCGVTQYRTWRDIAKGKRVHVSHSKLFYEKNTQSIPVYAKYGGQCVPVARTGAAFCAAAGTPAFLVAQPGHLAYMWKRTNGKWECGYSMFGWQNSWEYKGDMPWHGPPELIDVYEKFHADKASAQKSLLFLWLGNAVLDRPAKIAFYKMALERSAFNYDALLRLLGQFSNQSGSQKLLLDFLFEKVLSAYSETPLVVEELMRRDLFGHHVRGVSAKTREAFLSRGGALFAKSINTHGKENAVSAAALRFFLRYSSAKLSGGDPRTEHGRFLLHLRTTRSAERHLVLNELLVFVKSTLSNKELSAQYFGFVEELLKQSLYWKPQVLAFLGTLRNKDGTLQDSRVPEWETRIKALPCEQRRQPTQTGHIRRPSGKRG